MNRLPVSSSNLRSVGYDTVIRVLEIEFHSGGLYQYSNVPAHIHQGLISAVSKGSFFHANIKNNYSCEKIR